MARTNMYRKLPFQGGEPRLVSEVVNNCVEGKTNNSGEFSTTTSSTTSTLNDERIGFNSVILLMPLDSDSAAELTSIYFTSFAKGSVTVNHGSHVTARNYRYIIVG